MNKEQEELLFEVLSVLLQQDSVMVNPDYQEKLIKKCEKQIKSK